MSPPEDAPELLALLRVERDPLPRAWRARRMADRLRVLTDMGSR